MFWSRRSQSVCALSGLVPTTSSKNTAHKSHRDFIAASSIVHDHQATGLDPAMHDTVRFDVFNANDVAEAAVLLRLAERFDARAGDMSDDANVILCLDY